MKYSPMDLLRSKDHRIILDEKMFFEAESFKTIENLRGLEDVYITGSLDYDKELDYVYANLNVSGTMIVPCAITYEDVEYPFDFNALEVFSFSPVEGDEDIHYVKGKLDLMNIVFPLIYMEVPLKVVKEGEINYPKGAGWEVIKEEDLVKEQKIDPRLAKLLQFKTTDKEK